MTLSLVSILCLVQLHENRFDIVKTVIVELIDRFILDCLIEMSHTVAGRAASSNGESLEKGRVAVTKVRRYWKGRAPEWLEEEHDTGEREQKRETSAPMIVSKTPNDPRLERLSLVEVDRDTTVPAPAHRRMHQAAPSAVTSETATVAEEDEGEEAVFQRRAQLRLKLLETRKDEPALLSDEEDEEEESSDEYEDSEEEDNDHKPQRLLMKPVFVSADARETIQERERMEEEEEREWEAQKQKLQQRKEDTKEIVCQKIREEEDALQAGTDLPTEAADINTDDDAEEEDAEFESWKEREMNRIKRDKEEILATEKYAEEREKLKNMTEEERELYERQNPKVSGTETGRMTSHVVCAGCSQESKEEMEIPAEILAQRSLLSRGA